MSTAPTASVRVLGRERTRARIVDAARTLFVQQGYRATSLRDIAAAAGISHPGLAKHVSSKDELLSIVLAQMEEDSARAMDAQANAADGSPRPLPFSTLAALNAATPGYVALFAALTGEASTPAHPSHAAMARRYEEVERLSLGILDRARRDGTVHPDRATAAEMRRFDAIWDGLQLMSLFLPDRIDVPARLAALEERWREPPPAEIAPPRLPPRAAAAPPAPREEHGYRTGRARRAQILAAASDLFARDGYGDTALARIAQSAGASKSAVLHHFGSKEGLLEAVLDERDRALRALAGRPPDPAQGREGLDLIARQAQEASRRQPGLIQLYAVLSCEAAAPAHPAHTYVAERFVAVLADVTALFGQARDRGELPPHRDPEQEAMLYVALWDGLQYRWLYDREVDISAELGAHLAQVLSR
ncbi:TetR/AcrR family transcriptional regulator [Brachybacterium hainanense]|uniref:TetR/AcrR family transcriptional regulator n=1 Tax=Brachybacterium hainanense TaxID=1541174 RepID=A0ABV6RG39_9MICO